MKKIIKGMAAGLAVLLGFASCSGNLQDNDPKDFPLYVVGDIALDAEGKGTRLPFTFENFDADGNEIMSYSFTYDASKMNAWGGGKGTANFKIVATSNPNDWSKDWGGEKDTAITDVVVQDVTKSDTNEYVALNMRKGANTNPGNIIVKDLSDKADYKLTVKYNRAEDAVSVKFEGIVTYIPKFYVVQADKDPIEMSRAGSIYSWEFKAEKDEVIQFKIRQDDNEWYAYSTEDEVAAAEAMTFAPIETLEAMSFTCKKDTEYKITVNATDSAAITISGGMNNILGSAGITGFNNGWGVGEPLTITGKDTAEFAFEGALDSIEFAIQEVAGTWNPRWFAGIPEGKEKPATDKLMGAITATKTNTVTDADYVEAIYYEADPGMDGSNISVKGLPLVGSYKFKLLFKVLDAEKKTISIACVAQESIPAEAYSTEGYTDISAFGVAGQMNGWDTAANLTKVSDHVYTYSFKGNGDDMQFGLQKDGWGTKFTGATITIPATLNEESAAVTLLKGNSNNNKIEGTKLDADYVLTFTENNDYSISVTIKQTSEGSSAPVVFTLDAYGVAGNFNGWDTTANLTKVSDTVYTYEFTGTGEALSFGLQTAGWSTKYTGATIVVPATLNTESEAFALTKNADDNNAIAESAYGATYILTFTIGAENAVSCTVKQTTAGGVKPSLSLDNYKVSGEFNSWGNGELVKVSDTVYTYTFTAIDESSGAKNQFGLQTGGWATKFTGATIAVGEEAQTLTKGADNNNVVTGCTAGSSYTITFTITDAANEVVTASVAAAE